MSQSLGSLTYAGPAPAPRRGFFATCWRAIVFLVTTTILIVFVTLRAALLAAGFACVFAGLILLTLGGKRGAARKLLEWRERFVDLVRLWAGDIARPLRRYRRQPADPIPVVSVSSQ